MNESQHKRMDKSVLEKSKTGNNFLGAESSKGQQLLKCDCFVSQFDARDREDLFESRRYKATLRSKMCVVNYKNLFYY